MRMCLRGVLAAILVAWANAAPSPLSTRSGPTLPSQDSFYAASDNITQLEPGTILKHREPPYPIAAFGISPVNINASHQVLYRTTNSFGNAIATVLTIIIPHNADRSKVLSYQVAEDAASFNCAPSYALQLQSATGPLLGTIITQAELLLVEAALEQGWVVIIPDFQGPNSAYLANKLAAYATLDGIRAALNSTPFTGINPKSTITMWGYSGGSLPTNHAVELQPEYAPELRIAGAAVGGTVPNITNVVTAINGGPFAFLIPSGILGLASEYPDLKKVVEDHLKPEASTKFHKAGTQCLVANAAEYVLQDIIGMFDDRQLIYRNPTAVRILGENALGKRTPKIPLYWYKSVLDEVSPVRDSDAVIEKYCANGASIEYVRDIASEHGNYAIIGAAKAFSWLKNIMDGGKAQQACSKKTVISSLVDIASLEIIPKFLIDALLDLLHKPVGPLLFG